MRILYLMINYSVGCWKIPKNAGVWAQSLSRGSVCSCITHLAKIKSRGYLRFINDKSNFSTDETWYILYHYMIQWFISVLSILWLYLMIKIQFGSSCNERKWQRQRKYSSKDIEDVGQAREAHKIHLAAYRLHKSCIYHWITWHYLSKDNSIPFAVQLTSVSGNIQL